jgi:hypothetical protein
LQSSDAELTIVAVLSSYESVRITRTRKKLIFKIMRVGSNEPIGAEFRVAGAANEFKFVAGH